jgi:alpha-mannosidase
MTEADTRSRLGIPADAANVIILSQSSHLDWDWLVTFPELCSDPNSPYFHQNTSGRPAFEIFDAAVELILKNASAQPPYYYSVAEVGFLQAYANVPGKLQPLQQCRQFLTLCGGGITSPDNLLPHGETFIRNSLVAQRWNAGTLRLPVQNLWIPDDFGHDSQLPVAVAAMGLVGAGFARVPGSATYTTPSQPPYPTSTSLSDQLARDGVDFLWRANDGSQIVGHFMQNGYSQGDKVGEGDPMANIKCYYDENRAGSKTPYVFIPVGSDFLPPVGFAPGTKSLLDLVNQWNAAHGNGATGPFAVAGTFDQYVQLVWPHLGPSNARPFDAVPYWTGMFSSRPANKIFHYDASRTLLAAEVLGLIADSAVLPGQGPTYPRPNPTRLAAQHAAWDALVPSTHHDYITGTSGTQFMDVNKVEQLPLLTRAKNQAQALCTAAVAQIADGIRTQQVPGATPVVVCNPLGFARRGMVVLPGGAATDAQSALGIPGVSELVQPAKEGSLLVMASAPSLGYSTVLLRTTPPAPGLPRASLNNPDPGVYVLRNEFIEVEVTFDAGGGIGALRDLRSTTPSANLLRGTGNDLAFYTDTGNIYRYGNEPATGQLTPLPAPPTKIDFTNTELGPVRASITTTATVNGLVYTRTYSLVAGEPFLRMTLSGSLPANTSLFSRFTFAAGRVDSLTHGTPYHWSDATTIPYWPLPVFYATHNYLLPIVNGLAAAAIYHEGVPSWGYDDQGNLLGNVLRNTLGSNDQGAVASDFDTHVQNYALRVPSGMAFDRSGPRSGAAVARTGQPLREALLFNTPMVAQRLTSPGSPGPYPLDYSLASAVESPAFITAAKAADDNPSSVILRLYQPTGAALPVQVSTSVSAAGARVTTALEGAFAYPAQQPPTAALTSSGATGFGVNMARGLATVRLDRPGT